jgi:flagellar motor switch protein FliM
VITTQKDIHSPLTVCVEGVPKFHARPGAFKGHKAILVEGTVENPVRAAGG